MFFVNVPVGVLLALSLHRGLPRNAARSAPGRLDLLGAALVTAATGTLLSALIQAGDRGWTSAATGLLAVTAAGLYPGAMRGPPADGLAAAGAASRGRRDPPAGRRR